MAEIKQTILWLINNKIDTIIKCIVYWL
jgi:hypothetical protein